MQKRHRAWITVAYYDIERMFQDKQKLLHSKCITYMCENRIRMCESNVYLFTAEERQKQHK